MAQPINYKKCIISAVLVIPIILFFMYFTLDGTKSRETFQEDAWGIIIGRIGMTIIFSIIPAFFIQLVWNPVMQIFKNKRYRKMIWTNFKIVIWIVFFETISIMIFKLFTEGYV